MNRVRIEAALTDKVSQPLTGIVGKFDALGKNRAAAAVLQGVGLAGGIGAYNALGTAIGFAVDKARAAIEDSSRLQQSVGAVQSVLGEGSTALRSFGIQAANSFGLSKREVNELGAVLGAQLQGMGYETKAATETIIALEKRGADLAATFGGTTSDAIQAMSALLRGERDPIERYGVSIKEADVQARIAAKGLDVSTAAAKKNATAVASLDLLMEQTARSQGQFARESDSMAGASARVNAQLENLSAKLGDRVLPALAKATDGFADLLDGIDKIGKSAKGNEDPLTNLANLFDDLGQRGEKSKTFIGTIDEALTDLADDLIDNLTFWDGWVPAVEDRLRRAERSVETSTNAMVHRHAEILENGAKDVAAGAKTGIADPMAAAAADGAARAKATVARTPQQLAAALMDRRKTWQDAWSSYKETLKNEMDKGAEIAKLKGILASKRLAQGLKSNDPVVRAAAEALRATVTGELARLEGRGGTWGKGVGLQFARGLRGTQAEVARAAAYLAKAVANNLEVRSPAKEGPLSRGGPEAWGERSGVLWAKGMDGAVSEVRIAASRLAAAAIPTLSGPTMSAGRRDTPFAAPVRAARAGREGSPVILQFSYAPTYSTASLAEARAFARAVMPEFIGELQRRRLVPATGTF